MLPSFNVVSSNRSKCFSTSLNSIIDLSKYFREFSTTSLWIRAVTTVAKCSDIVVESFNEWQHISLPSTLWQKWIFFSCSCVVYSFFRFSLFSFKKWNEQIWTIVLMMLSYYLLELSRMFSTNKIAMYIQSFLVPQLVSLLHCNLLQSCLVIYSKIH